MYYPTVSHQVVSALVCGELTNACGVNVSSWFEVALAVVAAAFVEVFVVARVLGHPSTEWCERCVKLCSRLRLATAAGGGSVIVALGGLALSTRTFLALLAVGAASTLAIAALELWAASNTRGVHFSPFVFPVTM